MTLPKGRVLLDAFFEINLASGAEFKPFSLSPDVWYGATDDITVGLVHSAVGTSGFIGGTGESLCLAGTGGGCADVYHNVGVDVRYKLKTGMLAYAAEGGLYAITPKISAALQLGVFLPFENTDTTYRIPLSIGGHYQVNESINVNLAFSLPAVAGGGLVTGFDARTITLGGTYAF